MRFIVSLFACFVFLFAIIFIFETLTQISSVLFEKDNVHKTIAIKYIPLINRLNPQLIDLYVKNESVVIDDSYDVEEFKKLLNNKEIYKYIFIAIK